MVREKSKDSDRIAGTAAIPLFSPFTPVIRPGHYDHVPESLQPSHEVKDAIPRHQLEKSSSYFLNDLETPPTTPSEDERGQVGFHMMCLGKKKHHVARIYETPTEINRLGTALLFIIVLSKFPALILQLLYVFVNSFRVWLVTNNVGVIVSLILMLGLSLALKYFAGLARPHPFHIIMIVTKSILFAITYTLFAALTEYIFLYVRVNTAFNVNNHLEHEHEDTHEEIEEPGHDDEEWEKLFNKYAENNSTKYGFEFAYANNIMFIYALLYGIFLMILLMVLVILTKITFFGATYPFISYTLTFVIVLVSTLLMLGSKLLIKKKTRGNVVWELLQFSVGPILGCVITEFLDGTLHGQYCPLESGEYLYAAAHY